MDPVFYVKMASIAVALALGLVVKRRAIDRMGAPTGRDASRRAPWPPPSLGMWTVAIVAGRLMAYLKK